KNYATQRGLRIPVYDHDFQPAVDETDWQPRWVVDQPRRDPLPGDPLPGDHSPGGWQSVGSTFHFAPRNKEDRRAESGDAENPEDRIEWVHYRHWIRQGGSEDTSVPFDGW